MKALELLQLLVLMVLAYSCHAIPQAEAHQQLCSAKFEKLSETGKQELQAFKTRRVTAFRKNLVDLTELEIKHAKSQVAILRSTLAALREL